MKQQDTNKMRSLYEQWLVSGQSLAGFARENGFSASTFYYWVQKFKPEITAPSTQKTGFSKLTLDTPAYPNQPLAVVTYPSGVKIELHTLVSAMYLKELC